MRLHKRGDCTRHSGRRKLKEGDIFSVDVGAIVKGFHGDSAFTVGVGDISDEAQRLIDHTREALKRGIAQAIHGARIGDIGSAVQKYAEGQGYSVCVSMSDMALGARCTKTRKCPTTADPGTEC